MNCNQTASLVNVRLYTHPSSISQSTVGSTAFLDFFTPASEQLPLLKFSQEGRSERPSLSAIPGTDTTFAQAIR